MVSMFVLICKQDNQNRIYKSVHKKGLYRCKDCRKELGVTQKTAWFIEHRIRFACKSDGSLLKGIVEVDESYIGGSFSNIYTDRKKQIENEGKTWHDQKA